MWISPHPLDSARGRLFAKLRAGRLNFQRRAGARLNLVIASPAARLRMSYSPDSGVGGGGARGFGSSKAIRASREELPESGFSVLRSALRWALSRAFCWRACSFWRLFQVVRPWLDMRAFRGAWAAVSSIAVRD